jgi:hypothetical protein
MSLGAPEKNAGMFAAAVLLFLLGTAIMAAERHMDLTAAPVSAPVRAASTLVIDPGHGVWTAARPPRTARAKAESISPSRCGFARWRTCRAPYGDDAHPGGARLPG